MAYQTLSIDGFIAEFKEVSGGTHPRQFCFVLGAGASVTSGIPSGQILVKQWDDELNLRNSDDHAIWKRETGITQDNMASFYSDYYDRRFDFKTNDGYNYLEQKMARAAPSIGYIILAHLLSTTQNNVVITTNFDDLIERAFADYYPGQRPLMIGHEALAHYADQETTRPKILKIHRDLLLSPKNRTVELAKLHENWQDALSWLFSRYHPVFIGYAGNDPSVMNFLNENAKKFKNNAWKFPYWITYKGERLNRKADAFLAGADGYLIPGDGFDRIMMRLGSAFDFHLPNRDDWLAGLTARYDSMAKTHSDFFEQIAQSRAQDDSEQTSLKQAIREIAEQSVSAVSDSDQSAASYHRRGVFLHAAGNHPEALKAKQKAVALEPDNAGFHDSLGVTLHEMGRHKEAVEEKREAIRLEPDNAIFHDNLGTTLHEMGRYEEAVEEIREAIQLEPDNAIFHDSLGATLHEMGRYEEALEETREAIRLEPDNAEFHNSLGVTLHEMGRCEEALEEKQEALRLEPDNARFHNNLAVTLRAIGRYGEALEEIRKAIQLEPDNAEFYDSLSVTLYAMGHYMKAMNARWEAIKRRIWETIKQIWEDIKRSN